MPGFRLYRNNFIRPKPAKPIRSRLPDQGVGIADHKLVCGGVRRAGQFDLVVGRCVIGARRRGVNRLRRLDLFQHHIVLRHGVSI